MRPAFDIDPVVRTAQPDELVNEGSQLLVDCETGNRVEPRAGGMLKKLLKRSRRYLLVSNSRHVGAEAVCRGLAVPVGDFATSKQLSVSVEYRVTCPPDNEERVARALSKGNNPQEQLNSLIRSWIAEYTRGREVEFLTQQYAERLTELAQEIRRRAALETGLALEPRLRAQGEEKLAPISIGPLHIPVRVADYRDELDLELTARLGVDPNNTMAALLAAPQAHKLEQTIRAAVIDFSLRRVTLHAFEYELESEVRGQLAEHLNSELQAQGRPIEFLALKAQHFGYQRQRRIDYEFQVRLYEYPDPVGMHTSLLLELRNTGRYVAAGSPDVETWARTVVREVVDRCLFKATYVDLSTQLDQKKAEVHGGVQAEAAKIGFEVTQITTVTDLLVDILRDDFAVDVEGSYATAAANIPVSLAIHTRLRIPDPLPLANLFNRRVDVEESIREQIRQRAADVLHTTHPESFYLYFDVPKKGEKEAVRERLRKTIQKKIEDKFHAKVSDVVPKQIEDELITLYRKLREEARSFEVEVAPLGGSDPVRFSGIFRVDGVDQKGWNEFNLRRPTLDKLQAAFVARLAHDLAERDAETLLDTDDIVKSDARELVSTIARDEFGVLVMLTGWVRKPTIVENWGGGERRKNRELVSQLKDVERQRVLMAHQQKAELRQQEIGTLAGQIEALQAHYRQLVEQGDTAEATSVRQTIGELTKELDAKLNASVDIKHSLGQIRSPGLLLQAPKEGASYAEEQSSGDAGGSGTEGPRGRNTRE